MHLNHACCKHDWRLVGFYFGTQWTTPILLSQCINPTHLPNEFENGTGQIQNGRRFFVRAIKSWNFILILWNLKQLLTSQTRRRKWRRSDSKWPPIRPKRLFFVRVIGSRSFISIFWSARRAHLTYLPEQFEYDTAAARTSTDFLCNCF